jgi:hypothetical protein
MYTIYIQDTRMDIKKELGYLYIISIESSRRWEIKEFVEGG